MSNGNLKSYDINTLKWPAHLRTPAELLKSLKQKTKLRLLKSPICSKIVLQIVGGSAHILCNYLNETKIFNKQVFDHELRLLEITNNGTQTRLLSPNTSDDKSNVIANNDGLKQDHSPLITYSNHISCLDDPLLWACLFPWHYYTTQTDSIRWIAAATEICFTNALHSTFFSLGKTFPIVRGIGLNQPAMDFAYAVLKHNQWLHLFPEGRVMRDKNRNVLSNLDRGYNFKWGISKLILDYFKASFTQSNMNNQSRNKILRILPFYHLGLDDIFPVGGSYIPSIGKRITIFIRPSTIELNQVQLIDIIKRRTISAELSKSKSDDQLKLVKLTNFLEDELEQLKGTTYMLHNQPKNNGTETI